MTLPARLTPPAPRRQSAPRAGWVVVVAALVGGCATPIASPPGAGDAAPAAPTAGAPAAAASGPGHPDGRSTAAGKRASPPVPAPAAAATASARPTASPPATPTPQPPGATTGPGNVPPPFATVIKDARRIDGPITAWQKDDRLWFEVPPELLGRPFLFTPKIRQGLGEGLLLGGLSIYPTAGAGGAQVVEFTRVHNTIRLQARNTDVAARPGTPEALAVQASYTASLLGVSPVASQPHPDRKSVLVDAGAILLNDLAGIGMQLQRQYRQGYSLDSRNSVVTAVRGNAEALVVETQNHWYTPNVSTGQTTPPSALAGGVAPSAPRWLPDTRSLLIGMHLSFVPLPDPPMPPRRADPRLGFFTARVADFGNDLARTPIVRHITRWRLEKKDPAAARSEPVRPIVFRIDRNVPHAYRDTVREGILEWNRAFERIGFIDAIRVVQQEDGGADSTLDPGGAAVRWLLSAEPEITAIGQIQTDPRTGEILGADLSFEGLFTRAQRWLRSQLLATSVPPAARSFAEPPAIPGLLPGHDADGHRACRHGDGLAEQAAYALDLMDARGEIDPGSPEAQQFVLDYVKDTVMHEVGHALGLRHNFRASRAYTEAELSDADFTRRNGTTGSVMEYTAVNLAWPGQSGGVPFQLTLGPYDYWAIEYAYKPLPPGVAAADEEAQLQAVASRSHEPHLAFGTDEDASGGLDAETIQFDLGDDPLAFARKRLEIARDLFRRQESRTLPPDRDYSVLRRSLGYALSDATRAVGVLVRQLGGLRTLRDHPGSGRDPIEPVAVAVQRQAFDLVARAVFSAEGFVVSPALQRRLAPDYLDRGDRPASPTDFNVPQRLLEMQRTVLAYLLGDALAARLLDANDKLDPGRDRLEPAEIYARLGRELWSELDRGGPIAQGRRELQRDHVNRVAFALLRPSPAARADARGAMRREAQALLGRIDRALARKGGTVDAGTRLHLLDSADSLRQALSARVPRAAV